MTTQRLPYINRDILSGWAGPNELREGQRIFEAGWVEEVEVEEKLIRGTVQFGSRGVLTRFRFLNDGTIENLCPCRDSRERGLVCCHAIALGLAYIDLTGDPHRDRALRIEEKREREARRGRESGLWRLADPGSTEGVEAGLRLKLDPSWQAVAESAGVFPLLIQVRAHGRNLRADKTPTNPPLRFNPEDHALVYILEDMAGGALPGCLPLSPDLMVQLLHGLRGGTLLGGPEGQDVLQVLDRTVVPHLSLEEEAGGDGRLSLVLDLPSTNGGGKPFWIIGRKTGWAYHEHAFHPLEAVLPSAYRDLYRAPRRVPRRELPRFLGCDAAALEEQILLDQRYPADRIRYTTGNPIIAMLLAGNHEQLTLTLVARYGTETVPCSSGGAGPEDFAAPDPDDPYHYWLRDPAAEQAAIDRLTSFGIAPGPGDALAGVSGTRQVVDFLASRVPAMRAAGWGVEYGGWLDVLTRNAEWVVPSIDYTREGEDAPRFSIRYDFLDGQGKELPPQAIEDAYLRGESCIEWEGRTLLLDRDLLHALHQTLGDLGIPDAAAGRVYAVDGVHAGYALAAAENLRGITLKADALMTAMAERQNRLLHPAEFPVPERLVQVLRPYQKEGIGWLTFLERNGFGGILADEMGLGKTVQTLVWLEQMWQRRPEERKPALVVCPTSLVVNWAEESRKFTPDLRVLMMTGSDRHENWDSLGDYDLVITSYALLRRDVHRFREVDFSAAVLDEAQHIKNHSTQNARAAKQIQAGHRLVLTGTPMENSVSDLWSIFDFLMPGYLGNHAQFRRGFETPISGSGPDAALAHARLHRKVHPFLLRRMKKEVAKELPDKIDRVAYCDMTPDQARMYRKILETSTRQLTELVENQGFARSRFTVLKTLTRLRQVCCHLELLHEREGKITQPSAKLDLLQELMDEAMDSGHRVLLFSQFVSMLTILRRELDQRNIPYCYLDGSTVKRLEEVHRFNGDESIPLFLISLKAGGTGLNLTGADMVIHYDPWWNPAVEDQATDRAHRIGQSKTVYNIKLITRNSIEEKVLALQERKRTMIDATLQQQKDLISQLTWEDIKELLTL